MKKWQLISIMIVSLAMGLAIGYLAFRDVTSTHGVDHEHQVSNEGGEIWTCSMHPQIRQEELGDCPICGMDLIPLSDNNSDDPLILQMTPAAVELSNIQTTHIGDISPKGTDARRLSGLIQKNEKLVSTQVAHVPGRIEKLYVDFTGEMVYKGQKIARIYSPELINAQNELLEAQKMGDINPGLKTAAINKLLNWKIDSTQITEILERGNIIEEVTVYADQNGVVTNKNIAQGDYVRVGEPLFTLANLRKVWAVFDAYEDDLAELEIGDQLLFTTPALPGQEFSAKISFIDPLIDLKSRVARVRAELNNYDGKLKPGMIITGTLVKEDNSSIDLLVPKSAVLWTGKRSVVYTRIQDSKVPSFMFREVKLGKAIGPNYVVLEGLEQEDEVVTHGAFVIDAAAQLNNQASMMNRNVVVKEHIHDGVLPDYSEIVPPLFKEQLINMLFNYVDLKDALVTGDAGKASEAGQILLEGVNNIENNKLKPEALEYWNERLRSIESHGNTLAASTTIDKQRREFEFLSEAIINTIRTFGIEGEKIYIQHCPMANDNKGADWISLEEQIRNPYFGNKMLKCGTVKQIIN